MITSGKASTNLDLKASASCLMTKKPLDSAAGDQPTKDLIEDRRDYIADTLVRSDLQPDPIDQFSGWLADARSRKIIDATAMVLSTVDTEGQPHARMVLLKNLDTSGFVFYSNYNSDKGQQLINSDKASLLFYWCELERQVRIEGTVKQIDTDQADQYFHSRPAGSRFSAAASAQSAPVANRGVLEQAVAKLESEYPDGKVPRPAHWGGYILEPVAFEFWQGRADRLHDRFRYTGGANGTSGYPWSIERLSP